VLRGGAGNDNLSGGGGADQLYGGAGDDTYWVAGDDVVVESVGEGYDQVNVYFSYVLPDNVERLVFDGSYGDLYATFTGNELDNFILSLGGNHTIYGLGGNDTISAVLGGDTMYGGSGNDTYIVNGSDTVVESANQGIDTVQFQGQVSNDSYTLAANVENLLLRHGWGGESGFGNDLDNVMTGNDLDNSLFGAGGNDTLDGGGGNDLLHGGAGADHFVFTSKLAADADRIDDFADGDLLVLQGSVFTALGAAGALDPTAFALGTTATTAAQHVLYDATTGNLYYDADGSGAGSQVLVANLTNHPILDAGDVWVG